VTLSDGLGGEKESAGLLRNGTHCEEWCVIKLKRGEEKRGWMKKKKKRNEEKEGEGLVYERERGRKKWDPEP
jgi:hypothetical protein